MITSLPILIGDPVICQVIVQAPFADPLEAASDTCYAQDRFIAVGYPFRAKYNDYGYVEDIEEDLYTEDTLAYMREHLIERDLGENKFHDHEVRKGQLSWAKLDNWFHGKRVLFGNAITASYNGKYPKWRPVGLVMIHQEIYEAMANYGAANALRWNDRNYGDEIHEALSAPDDRLSFIARDKLRRHTQGRELNDPRNLQGADVDETALRLTRMLYFDIAMGLARKQWYPVSGAGSQSEEYSLFRLINTASDGIMRKREAEIAEDEEEDAA